MKLWNQLLDEPHISTQSLHMSHLPNDSVLATCGDSYCTLSLDLSPPHTCILKIIMCWGVAKVEFTRLIQNCTIPIQDRI